MNLEQAAQRFVELHKPSRIDLNFIRSGYGSVEQYLDEERGDSSGDRGERYIEISQLDSVDGATHTIEWFEEAYCVSYYSKPMEERLTREDFTPESQFDPIFDITIDNAIEFAKKYHDVTVTRWEGGEPVEDISLVGYLD